jgi:hypothetical protein
MIIMNFLRCLMWMTISIIVLSYQTSYENNKLLSAILHYIHLLFIFAIKLNLSAYSYIFFNVKHRYQQETVRHNHPNCR